MKQIITVLLTMCLCLNSTGIICSAEKENLKKSVFQIRLETYQKRQKAFQNLLYVFHDQLIKCCEDPKTSEEFKILNDIMRDVECVEEYLDNEG